MKSPSVKSMTSALRGLSAADARLIKKIAKAADYAEELEKVVEKSCPETAKYVHSMHSDPYRTAIWRVTVALHAIDQIVGTHGVEGLGPHTGEGYAPPYEYLNAGDTYATTLIYKRATDTLSIGCWGDIVERHPSWE